MVGAGDSGPSAVRWALIAGERGGPKVALVQAALEAFAQRGVSVAGFRQVRGTHEGHELVRLRTGERCGLSRLPGTAGPGEEPFCNRIFAMNAFEVAREWLVADGPEGAVWLIDEVSKLEAARRGHYAAIRWAFDRSAQRTVVLGVRADQLFEVMSALGLEHEPVASLERSADSAAVDAFADAIRETLVPG